MTSKQTIWSIPAQRFGDVQMAEEDEWNILSSYESTVNLIAVYLADDKFNNLT